MTLKEILKNIKVVTVNGSLDIEATGVDIDSRQVEQGHLFVAVRGTQTDGHQYIEKAVAQGATAILCEQEPESTTPGVTYVVTPSTEKAVGVVATTFYGNPSERTRLVGVTGTNGKTTIATLL